MTSIIRIYNIFAVTREISAYCTKPCHIQNWVKNSPVLEAENVCRILSAKFLGYILGYKS